MLNLKEFKHIHCIGIGGIGLSAVAEILASRGCEVSGSDMKLSDVTEHLISKGIKVYEGHSADNIKGADLIVYSAAVSPENPELTAAEAEGITVATRAEALGALMQDYPTGIAISGTHGKTTTTSMVSLILDNSETDPTILIGGNLPQYHGNVKIGHGDYFVTEACEYMDSFLSLHPKIEIILNIDSDHLDYFKDIEHIVNSFDKFAALIPDDGIIFAYDANPFVSGIIQSKELRDRVVTYGFSPHSDFYSSDIKFDNNGYPSFDVYNKGELLGRVTLSVPGEHNISNAMASIACCYTLGVDIESIINTLKEFKGTHRRFDIIGETSNGVKVIDDYAHHPTEISATLRAAQNMPHGRLWCLFQPHTYTRTMALFDEFTKCFDDADILIMAEIYAAREKNIHKISSKELINEIKQQKPAKEAYYFNSLEEIATFVGNNAQPGDVVITMGAGDIYKVAELLMKQ